MDADKTKAKAVEVVGQLKGLSVKDARSILLKALKLIESTSQVNDPESVSIDQESA